MRRESARPGDAGRDARRRRSSKREQRARWRSSLRRRVARENDADADADKARQPAETAALASPKSWSGASACFGDVEARDAMSYSACGEEIAERSGNAALMSRPPGRRRLQAPGRPQAARASRQGSRRARVRVRHRARGGGGEGAGHLGAARDARRVHQESAGRVRRWCTPRRMRRATRAPPRLARSTPRCGWTRRSPSSPRAMRHAPGRGRGGGAARGAFGDGARVRIFEVPALRKDLERRQEAPRARRRQPSAI